MKRCISILTSIMVMLSFTLPVELVFAEEVNPETEQIIEQEAKALEAEPAIEQEAKAAVLNAESSDEQTEEAAEEESAEPTAYVPNEVIVVFDNNKALKKAETTAEAAVSETEGEKVAENIEVATLSKADKAVLVQSEENIDELALCEELEDQKGVAYAQPNYLYTLDEAAMQSVNDTLVSDQWYLNKIQAQEAWDYIDGLESNWNKAEHPRVKVAALDTGIITGHEDLTYVTNDNKSGNISRNHCVSVKYTTSSQSGEPYETLDYVSTTEKQPKQGKHGTHTASIIGATSNNEKGVAGVAAGNDNSIIELMPIDVFSMDYSAQANATTADVVAGLDYAIDNGAKVIMMCLGHSWNSEDGNGDKHDDSCLHSKIKWATGKDGDSNNKNDAVIVCSAGNNNTMSLWYPSDFTEVISCINTVDYSDSTKKECRNSNSNYGLLKDISAPGTNIKYADNGTSGYDSSGGTSYSCAVVTGVAALVRYVNPNLTGTEVKSILCSTATDLYRSGFDIYTGWGNVNALNAVTAAGSSLPVADEHLLVHVDRIEPTCTTEGCKEFWRCSACGKIFSDSNAENEITVYELKLDKIPHNYTHYRQDGGYMTPGEEYDYCTVCNNRINYCVLPGYSISYVKSFKLSKGKKSFTAKWKKQSKKVQKQFSGYQLRWSTDPGMSNAAYKNVSKKKSSVKIKGAKKTRYYVQVRSYTGGFYSAWSPMKSVVTK